MEPEDLGSDAGTLCRQILGYLNFSSGATDTAFLANLNRLAQQIDDWLLPGHGRRGEAPQRPQWRRIGDLLQQALAELRGASEAFEQVDQAEGVLRLVFDGVVPEYRRFHRDLLFHQTEDLLFGPFFLGRACEAVLAQGGPWTDTERIVPAVIRTLNNYIGYRPVAVLHNQRKLQPYAHEWVRPLPLYVAGAGVAESRYRPLVIQTLEIIASTDPDLLEQAWFDPALLDELALDPRAYDFDHPVNRRPNYHFGTWDLHHLDQHGRYRRFVVHQVTLDAILERVERKGEVARDELLFEAAAVLAGTMLMASGITGDRPEAHGSMTTLATLLPHIAAYRDAFYERLLEQTGGAHGERLRAEARALRQPFGGARQDLNQRLARQRAKQLQHVHLAHVFAQMGYTQAAARQAEAVPVASARIQTQIHCRLTTAHQRIDCGQLEQAADELPHIEDLLHRAIECGAIVDPWNILGFGGQFGLFAAVENSIPDHRIDDLIEIMGEIFGLYARLEKTAAARGLHPLQHKLAEDFDKLARWWDRFATVEVHSVAGISGREASESAAHVASALAAWHAAGTAAGDVSFWRDQIERFHSPDAYALVVEALLDQNDPVGSMALLIQWIGRAEQVPLADGPHSFHALAIRWMRKVWRKEEEPQEGGRAGPATDRWTTTKRFFDYLEANAEEFWEVPRLEAFSQPQSEADEGGTREDDDPENLYGAAYEQMTYRDSTDDGLDAELQETGPTPTDSELMLEAERISKRLAFLRTLARLWKEGATASIAGSETPGDRDDVLAWWASRAADNHRSLLELLDAVVRYRVPTPSGSQDSLVEYDRRQAIKETLLERIITTCLETADAARWIRASTHSAPPAGISAKRGSCPVGPSDRPKDRDWETAAVEVLRSIVGGQRNRTVDLLPALLEELKGQPLLYVALPRGGNPRRIVASRNLQQLLCDLLVCLPRMGMLAETCRLIEIIEQTERSHPVGPGAVTEFDRLFEVGFRAIAECVVVSSQSWSNPDAPDGDADDALIDCLEQTTKPLLDRWIAHSRNVRLTVLESVADDDRWDALVQFIRRYGRDIFTQPFMNAGNLRAILHQGVESYLDALEEAAGAEGGFRLLEELDRDIPRNEAVRHLTVAIEAVLENYSIYFDYNSTTTQSDSGELLYTLLDFLRLRANYERIVWNLRPVAIAHETLVRHGRTEAAQRWQRAVAGQTSASARQHLARYQVLCKEHGMQLPTVADRVAERFVRPLAVDRLRALVRPAMEEIRQGRPQVAFPQLEAEVAEFTGEPTGVGFEVPSWLEALADEVERAHSPIEGPGDPATPVERISQVRLDADDILRQVTCSDPQ